jgi:hypothetical protein
MDEDCSRSLAVWEARFSIKAACIEYLATWRWPEGFVCPHFGGTRAWQTARGLWHCRQCRTQTSTAGTLFHRTRLSLPLWFRAIRHITSQKCGKLFFRLLPPAVRVGPVPGTALRAAIPGAPDADFDDLDPSDNARYLGVTWGNRIPKIDELDYEQG